MTRRFIALAVGACLAVASAAPVAAQQTDSTLLSVQRIFRTPDFSGGGFGPARWLEGGASYTTLEAVQGGKGQDIVRYATESGTREVLVPAAQLVPAGAAEPLDIEDYSWSPDQGALLIFTESRPVWRQNNRGDYWVLDRKTTKLRKLGGSAAKPSTLLFAKFSPDGKRIGYVRENNLYVEDLASGAITQLTSDGSRTIINGTFDWVYEEELDLRDGWRWSPDGASIAYWQLDADQVRDFALINNTDSLYSMINPVQYPKAGDKNSSARIGVVAAAGGPTRWVSVPGDPREHYLARMDWANNSTELLIQRLNRLQNTDQLLLADAATGTVKTVLTEQDSTWVDVVNDVTWLQNGKSFTWVSERDGWRHVYVVSRDGRSTRLVTPGAFDVLDVESIDEKGGWLYYIASPTNPTQRYLYRVRLDGKGKAERLTPADRPGTNNYTLSPDAKYAWHTYSRFGVPVVMSLVRLPTHAVVRTVIDNAKLKSRVAALRRGPAEFFQVDIGNGVKLNGYIMKPADFDSTRKYPILFQVYGGPGSQTVLDQWGGRQYLWHAMLAQQGYLVASIDNRGTGARGRDWRHIIYGKLGVLETEDQAAAARAIGRWSYVDSTRMGMWGWSYGGFMTLNALFRYPDVYRTGVAVAPVTHWSFYDNIYTERYNGLPQDNKAGYDQGSPLTYVNNLKGDLLLVHGSGDDNVHYQNSEALINALVAANKPFQMMEYPNRNHSISGGMTTTHLFELLTRYLGEHLGRGVPVM